MQPLSKVASGGEQSRVKLALKAVLGRDSGLTQLFDEIDSGISGSTAEKIGALMREMSVNQQIITITHLPSGCSQGRCTLVGIKIATSRFYYFECCSFIFVIREQEIARMLWREYFSGR